MMTTETAPASTARWNPQGVIDAMLQAGDPLGQETIDRIFALGGIEHVNRLLATRRAGGPALDRHEGVEAVLAEYLDRSAALPDWVDESKMQRSEAFFRQHGIMTFTLLMCVSLPQGYSFAMAARVLGASRRLEDDATRRMRETLRFYMDVQTARGLERTPEWTGPGIRAIQRVRLMHAAMRHLILTPPPSDAAPAGRHDQISGALLATRWDAARDGAPINQVAMSGTILSFSYVVLQAMRRLQIQVSPEEEQAYLHRWNVVGHLIGVHPDLLLPRPERMEDAERLFSLFYRFQTPCEDGRELTKAAVDYVNGRIAARLGGSRPPWPLGHLPRLMIRELVGERTANVLGVKLSLLEQIGAWLAIGLWHRTHMMELLDHLGHADRRALTTEHVAAQWLFRQMLDGAMMPAQGTPEFVIPDHLLTSWGVQPPGKGANAD